MRLVCISGKAQHGKDTTAQIFAEKFTQSGKKVLVTHYADLLKWMCKNYFNWNGEKDDFGRSLLQRVGTDVIRKQIPNFWVDWLIQLLKLFPNEWDVVIIPDCRFPNEINDLKDAFAESVAVSSIRVNRVNFESTLSEEQKQHISETALDEFKFDYIIENSSLIDLEAQVDGLIDNYFNA